MAHFWVRRQNPCYSRHEVQVRSAETSHRRTLQAAGVWSSSHWHPGDGGVLSVCMGDSYKFQTTEIPTSIYQRCLFLLPMHICTSSLHTNANLPILLCKHIWSSTATKSCPAEFNQQSINYQLLFLVKKTLTIDTALERQTAFSPSMKVTGEGQWIQHKNFEENNLKHNIMQRLHLGRGWNIKWHINNWATHKKF